SLKYFDIILNNSISCVCIPVSADTCPLLINMLNKYLLGSPPEYMESILYAGPLYQYKIDDVTKAALAALKKSIDGLSAEHVRAPVSLILQLLFTQESC
uniref:Uncharacterized protein n=1 Tax=Chelonoidis abingdonii TaxID=106734 RepID=A0A8C0FXA8_CHEAB